MSAKQLSQREFEASLKTGDRVCLRWRKGSGPAVIADVNPKSFSVKLSSGIGGYPAGSLVRVNRVVSTRWSASNCVRPEAGH